MKYLIETKTGAFKRMIAHESIKSIKQRFVNTAVGETFHFVLPDETFEEAIERVKQEREERG